MVTLSQARKAALALPEVEEKSHFEIPDFRVKNKIFCTLHESKGLLMVKLSLHDQSVFCSFDNAIIYPVPGGWGRKGATFLVLAKIKKPMLLDALNQAWKNVAPSSMAKKHFGNATPS